MSFLDQIRRSAAALSGGGEACRSTILTRWVGMMLMSLASATMLAGCGTVYLHDSANLGAAQKAQQQFAAVVQEGRSTSLVAGQRQQRQALDELDGALEGVQRDVLIAALSSRSWEQLAEAVAAERAEVDVELGPGTPSAGSACPAPFSSSDEALPRRVERDCVAKELQAKLVAAGAASDQATTLLEAMNQAAGAEARYTATQKLLSTGVVALVQPRSDPKARVAALEALAKETVPQRSFAEKDGQLMEKVGTTTVGEALGLDLQLLAKAQGPLSFGDVIQIVGKTGDLRAFQGLVPTNPGIEVTIIGLGYDVARAEELRLTAEVDGARRRLALHDRYLAFLERHQKTVEQAEAALEAVVAIRGIDEETDVRETMEKLRQRGRNARGDLSGTYSALAQYAKAILAERPVRQNFDNEVGAVLVDQELARADIALREREAVIVRGLDALVAFHEGGIDADDVRNLIGVAQAVGIFAIAAN